MTCPDCDGDDPCCQTCDGSGTICDRCGRPADGSLCDSCEGAAAREAARAARREAARARNRRPLSGMGRPATSPPGARPMPTPTLTLNPTLAETFDGDRAMRSIEKPPTRDQDSALRQLIKVLVPTICCPLPENIVLWRGAIPEAFKQTTLAGVTDTLVGKVFIDLGIGSTSLLRRIADLPQARGEGLLVKVLAPKGTRSAAPGLAAPDAGYAEAEIVLAPGMRFRVVKVEANTGGHNKKMVTVEIIP